MSRKPWKRRKPRRTIMEGPELPGNALATPETRRKFTKSSFARMCDKKEITAGMMQAAIEIERVYLALTRGLIVKGVAMEKLDRGHGDGLSDKVAWAYKARFKPWADRLSNRKRKGEDNALSVVIDVVVDGRFVEQMDREQRWRNGTARNLCQRALIEYAVMAQWTEAEELTEFDARQARLQSAA